MTLDEAIKHFRSARQVCLALGIAPQNATEWRKKGYIPYLQQYRIAEITDGVLMPDEKDPKEVFYS